MSGEERRKSKKKHRGRCELKKKCEECQSAGTKTGWEGRYLIAGRENVVDKSRKEEILVGTGKQGGRM